MAASGFASLLSAQPVCMLQSDCNGDSVCPGAPSDFLGSMGVTHIVQHPNLPTIGYT